MKLQRDIEYKVKGYRNKWMIVDTYGEFSPRSYALLENTTYGDETAFLLVEMSDNVEEVEYTVNGQNVILPTIPRIIDETYDDIITALQDAEIIRII